MLHKTFIFAISVLPLAFFNLPRTSLGQENYQKIALQLHNEFRQKHCSPLLTWESNLNSSAIRCAEYYANINSINHSCPHKNGAGENLFRTLGGEWTYERVAETASKNWYAEESNYNYSNPGFQPGTGHFTQLVWKSSERLGFAVAKATDGKYYGVALYSPAGNVQGRFRENVQRPC